MGSQCSTCQSCNGENKLEFNDDDPRSSIQANQQSKNYTTKTNSKFQGDLHFKVNVKKIIKIQSVFRGIKAREIYKAMIIQTKVQSKYFTDEEAKETLIGVFKDVREGGRVVTKSYKYKNGAVYNGQWIGGFRHGSGTMKWPDGAMYEGQWQYGQAFGQGKFFHTDGDIYEGQWSNNKANGRGVYTNVKGAKYEGQWKDDQQHGKGLETWHEGSQYEGNYVNGKKEGFGKYIWADGSVYEGDWLDNRINGRGVYLWKDGRKYYGEWQNNDMEGNGIYFWADGRRYEGQYHNDKKCGYGMYYWTDGRRYEGWWYKGKQHGLGTYLDPTKGKVKYGLWEGGKRVKWFDEQSIKLINQMTFDYTTQFQNQESANHVRPNSTFSKPEQFDQQINRIKRDLKVPAF